MGSVLSVTQPAPGAALVLVAAVSAFGDLTGSFYVLRRLTGRRASQNVTSSDHSGRPGTLVLVAHYDASRGSGLVERRPLLTVLFWTIVAVLLCALIRLPGLEGLPLTIVQFVPTVVLIGLVPLLVDIPLSPANEPERLGPQVVLDLVEHADLEHFDIHVVFTGAHHGLQLGMRAWLKRHKQELDPERTAFVDISSGREGAVRWVTREGIVVPARYHPELLRICEELEDGRPLSRWQASDALLARSAGFPALALRCADRERAYSFAAELIRRVDDQVGPLL